MTNVMRSETSDVNISSSINATTAETGTGSPAGHISAANAVIVRVTILLVMAVFNLCGNGFTLNTIRLTPRLWTKTNFILASMLASDITTGVFMFWHTPFMIFVYVFNDPCHYNVAVTITTWLYKVCGYVSVYHLILITVERYVAIVYPFRYEIMFTDRKVKWAICTCWVLGILLSMTWSFWLIGADYRKCDLISTRYYVNEVALIYLPVCISMFICYGRIFAISWRHRQRLEPVIVNPAPGTSGHGLSVNRPFSTLISTVSKTDDSKHTPMAGTGPTVTASPAGTSGTESASLAEQQRQKIKSRRREFKAVYLTAAIVGTFVILWFPNMLGRFLASIDYNSAVVDPLYQVGGAIGALNFSFSWIIYAAVSRKYRRAYREMLIRIGCCCCKNVTLPAADNSFVV